MTTAEARDAEHAKYVKAYTIETYRMGGARYTDAVRQLAELPCRGSYLDVGCGRGEMVREAMQLGFAPVCGVEVVPNLVDGRRVIYAEGHALPFLDRSWDVVTLFDVVEHLLPGDDEAVCRELVRVARRHILITANNHESTLPDGTVLHINRRPYAEWERLLAEWFAPGAAAVTACDNIAYERSPMWRVDL
jgi:SAM-dependent methyltransferase